MPTNEETLAKQWFDFARMDFETAKHSKRIFEAMGAVNVTEPVAVTWTRDEINERETCAQRCSI